MATAKSTSSPMRSLERALGVMQVLEQSRSPLRLSEVARRAGLHIATTQRILGTLERFGYVAQGSTGYAIGATSVLNAHSFIVSNGLSRAAAPILQELAAETRLSASIALRVGFSRVLIGRVEGERPMRYQMPIGERLPLHIGASGRVLASAMGPEEIDELLAQVGEIRLASGKIVPREQYLRELQEIRESGYAYGLSERILGAGSIAVPITGAEGETVAAIGLSVLAEGLDQEEIDVYVAEMRRASAAISARLV